MSDRTIGKRSSPWKEGIDVLLAAAAAAVMILPAPPVFSSGSGWAGCFLLLLLRRTGFLIAGTGALAAAAAGVFIGDRPWTAFLAVVEMALLAAWLKRGREDLLPAELAYQLAVAAPTAMFAGLADGGTAGTAATMAAGSLVTGAASALLADLAHHYRPFARLAGRLAGAGEAARVPLRRMIAHLAAGAAVVPGLFIVLLAGFPGVTEKGAEPDPAGLPAPATLMVAAAAAVLSSAYGAHWLSGRISGAFERLAAATESLHQKLRRGADVSWPDGGAAEAAEIAENCRMIADRLAVQYDTNERLTESLREKAARLRASEAALERLSYHDTLTSLPNRFYFYERLRSMMGEHGDRGVGVMMLDIDRFKQVNDSLGHASGDEMLRIVADRLRRVCDENAVICRLGGDEFAILVPGASRESLSRLGDAVIGATAEPVRVGERELYAGVSIGISLYPEDAARVEELVRNADTAMYTAKEAGGRRYEFYYSSMKEQVSERLEMETSLHKALELDQFELFYQPRMDADGKRTLGFEALIRWNRPGRGYVPPDLFIPLAEETGVIHAIGDWVLRTACRQCVAWVGAGYSPAVVAVNVSPRQFEDPAFVERVDAMLRETGMRPEWLELEITESFLHRDRNAVVDTLRRLKERGIRISIDDFGTGYSSLSQLKSLPIHAVKIDRTFIRHIDTDHKNASIVSAIMALAHSMNLRVVAEGVETEDELRQLRLMQCDELQGYYFSAPVRAEDAKAFLRMPEPSGGRRRGDGGGAAPV
jgi:diguanylate cyclase (GGDEF)-like protein